MTNETWHLIYDSQALKKTDSDLAADQGESLSEKKHIQAEERRMQPKEKSEAWRDLHGEFEQDEKLVVSNRYNLGATWMALNIGGALDGKMDDAAQEKMQTLDALHADNAVQMECVSEQYQTHKLVEKGSMLDSKSQSAAESASSMKTRQTLTAPLHDDERLKDQIEEVATNGLRLELAVEAIDKATNGLRLDISKQAVLDSKLLPTVQAIRSEHGEVKSAVQQSTQDMSDKLGASQSDANDIKKRQH